LPRPANRTIALAAVGIVALVALIAVAGGGLGSPTAPIRDVADPAPQVVVKSPPLFQTNGTYLKKFGASGTGTSQFQEPRGLALDSSGTLVVADAGNHRVSRWSHPNHDPQSGVTKVEVKVDNEAPNVFYNQPCAERDCSAAGGLLFNSGFYATGQHKVIVTATDGVKLTTPKELIVSTVKDTIKPTLTATSPFFTAPEGWVEQKSYSYAATAKDPGGYGITSLVLKIDGSTVNSVSQTCPNGGCEKSLSGSINMANYKGGAHPAELIATDGAGLKETKAWTVNVAPKGNVPAAEAEDTLEAVEETGGQSVLAPDPTTESLGEEAPPILKQSGTAIHSEGAPVESTMTSNPADGFTLNTSEGPVSITPVGTSSRLLQFRHHRKQRRQYLGIPLPPSIRSLGPSMTVA
jgi:hypothetical protein